MKLTHQMVDELRDEIDRLEKEKVNTCLFEDLINRVNQMLAVQFDLIRRINQLEREHKTFEINLKRVFNDAFPLERI